MTINFDSVLEAKNVTDFESAIVNFAHNLDFDIVSATTVFDQTDGTVRYVTASNTPESYEEGFLNRDKACLCPVMQHCKNSNIPLIWDQNTYTKVNKGHLWEEQAQFGYKNGIALALHMPGGTHFHFGVDRSTPLPQDKAKQTRLLADIQLFAIYAQEAGLRLLQPNIVESSKVKLTDREKEVLWWTFVGKTAWETGKILGISERTAVFHANNALHKMGCATKHQAAARAHNLGLLALPQVNSNAPSVL